MPAIPPRQARPTGGGLAGMSGAEIWQGLSDADRWLAEQLLSLGGGSEGGLLNAPQRATSAVADIPTTILGLPDLEAITGMPAAYKRMADQRGTFSPEMAEEMALNFTPMGVGAGIVRGAKPVLRTPEARAIWDRVQAPGRTAITDVSIRNLPLDDALQIARTEAHVIPSGSGMVGAPPHITNRRQLQKARRDFDAQVEEGLVGANWYDKARAANIEVTGGGQRAHRLAQEKGLTSSQSTPDANLGQALSGHNAAAAGRPLEIVRTRAQAGLLNRTYKTGEDMVLGRKIDPYTRHIDPTVTPPITGANDIWYARSWGFKNPNDKLFDRNMTAQEHAWTDAETVLAVDRANARKMGGRSDWTAAQIQAAPWVYRRGAEEMKRFPKKFKDMDAAMKWAAEGYGDFYPKYTFDMPWEHIPGAGTGHMGGLLDAPYPLRKKYSDDPRGSATGPGGRDIHMEALDLYARPSLPAHGVFRGPAGLEQQPAEIARALGGFGYQTPYSRSTPHGPGLLDDFVWREGTTEGTYKMGKDYKSLTPTSPRTVTPATAGLLDTVAATKAYVGGQNAVPWHNMVPFGKAGVKASEATSITFGVPPNISRSKVSQLAALADKHGFEISHRGGDVSFMNVRRAEDGTRIGPTAGQVAKMVKDPAFSAALNAIDPAITNLQRAKMVGSYVNFEDVFKLSKAGSGEATRRLEQIMTDKRAPDALRKMDASPEVRANALGQLERDAEYAAEHGFPLREDLQRARKIISEEGFTGLFEALRRGVVLPVIGLALFSPLLGSFPAAQDGSR